MEIRNDTGRKVKVYDTARKRWYKGTVLHVERLDENNQPNGWSVELTNGNRGLWDVDNLQFEE